MINPSFGADPPTFPPPKTCGACDRCQMPDADLRYDGRLAYCVEYHEFVMTDEPPSKYHCELWF